MMNKEDTPWEKTDWFKSATEQYGLSRVLPPSGEKQEDKCKVEDLDREEVAFLSTFLTLTRRLKT